MSVNTKDEIDFESVFTVGEWLINQETCHIRNQDSDIKLEPKVMSVLVCLARHAGHVVSREELEGTVWAGMVVGYDALSGSVIKLRKAFGDNSRNPRYIETISKKGYRLVAAVKPAKQDSEKDADTHHVLKTKGLNKKTVINIVFVVLVILLFLFADKVSDKLITENKQLNDDVLTSPQTTLPRVLVLPFSNLNDSEQEYLSDGITSDVITDLSRLGSLHVIAAHSANYFKNKVINLTEIAKELDVQYFIEGSVQVSGDRVRVNTRLTNTVDGHHIWAERFEGDINNLFNIQDEIAKKIINELFVTSPTHEKFLLSPRTIKNYHAYDAFLRGLKHSTNRTKQGYDLTVAAYEEAIKHDPEYARVYGALAVTHTFGYRHEWSEQGLHQTQRKALELVNRAVFLNELSPQVYWSKGFVHLFRKEYDLAEHATLKAIKLAPNYADAYGLLAFIANWRGKAGKAVQYIDKAITLNPYHTFDYPWNKGLAFYTLGRYKEAIVLFEDALERNETSTYPRLYMAACYVNLGDIDEAQWQIEQILVHRPNTTIKMLSEAFPYENPEHKLTILNDLKAAGLP